MRSSSGLNFRTLVIPNLFNDLHKVTKYLYPIMSADDTILFYCDKNIKIVKSELKLVNEWFLANNLSLNAKKTKVCFIS